MTGEFPEGFRLPTENDLGTQMNVGRGCVREALIHLQNQNILIASPGRGTYVADDARARICCSQLNEVFNSPKNTDSLADAISVVEPHLVSKIVLPVNLKKVEKINELLADVIANKEGAWKLRESICELSGDTVLFSVYRAMLETYEAQNSSSEQHEQELNMLQKVVDAISLKNAAGIVENWPKFTNK